MDGLAVLNIVGVAANGLFAALMAALLAAALLRADGPGAAALRPPLWPRWAALVEARGSALGAALCLAGTAPVLINCFACHQSLHPLLPALRPYTAARARGVVAAAIAGAAAVYLVIAM